MGSYWIWNLALGWHYWIYLLENGVYIGEELLLEVDYILMNENINFSLNCASFLNY